ncbi:MAG: NlpC/P60 family protein [Gammaproteobacteria bacterium]|nr:NlpC/P60 family protein [Gammaproteobacteria bacterium]
MNKILLLLLASLSLLSCSSSPDTRPGTLADIPIGKKVDLNNSSTVKNKLYSQYKSWKGVKYKMGGLSKSGVDCSGFVYATFRSKLGINIPRSTELQISTGKPIDKNKLKAGDLVFFKTKAKVRHVGIYLENNNFLHASTSKGVMISKLDNVYWKSKYWKSRRP